MGLDQLLERNAHGLFDVAGAVHVARDTEHLGAAVLRPADACEPCGTTPQDGGHDRDGLDVVDRGGAAVDPDRGRERRLVAGHALLALEAFQERGLLAADVGAGAAMEMDLEIEAGAAGVLAHEAGRVGLFDRELQPLGLVDELAADIDVAGMGAHAHAREQTALEQLMRVVAQDVAVLARAGLGLVGVQHEIAGPVAGLGHERHLEAGREPRSAAPAQSGFLDLLDDPVPPLEDEVSGAGPVTALARAREPPVVLAIEIREDAVLIREHSDLRRS